MSLENGAGECDPPQTGEAAFRQRSDALHAGFYGSDRDSRTRP
jgi:hypothetical protein